MDTWEASVLPLNYTRIVKLSRLRSWLFPSYCSQVLGSTCVTTIPMPQRSYRFGTHKRLYCLISWEAKVSLLHQICILSSAIVESQAHYMLAHFLRQTIALGCPSNLIAVSARASVSRPQFHNCRDRKLDNEKSSCKSESQKSNSYCLSIVYPYNGK